MHVIKTRLKDAELRDSCQSKGMIFFNNNTFWYFLSFIKWTNRSDACSNYSVRTHNCHRLKVTIALWHHYIFLDIFSNFPFYPLEKFLFGRQIMFTLIIYCLSHLKEKKFLTFQTKFNFSLRKQVPFTGNRIHDQSRKSFGGNHVEIFGIDD